MDQPLLQCSVLTSEGLFQTKLGKPFGRLISAFMKPKAREPDGLSLPAGDKFVLSDMSCAALHWA